MPESLYHPNRMWRMEVEMYLLLNMALAIYNLQKLLLASISTREYQHIIN